MILPPPVIDGREVPVTGDDSAGLVDASPADPRSAALQHRRESAADVLDQQALIEGHHDRVQVEITRVVHHHLRTAANRRALWSIERVVGYDGVLGRDDAQHIAALAGGRVCGVGEIIQEGPE